MNICDRVIIIDNGKIGWDGKLSEYISLVTQNQEQQAKNN
jgi:ABC-type multidrug transport system ATPase subunit